MSKIFVTSLGPIDRHAPGTDVTGIYNDETLKRLIEDGYVEIEQPPAPKKSGRKAKTNDGD